MEDGEHGVGERFAVALPVIVPFVDRLAEQENRAADDGVGRRGRGGRNDEIDFGVSIEIDLFVLAGFYSADGKAVGLASGPRDAASEIVVASGCADPNVQLAESRERFVDLRWDGRRMFEIVHGRQIHGGDAIALVIVDHPAEAGGECFVVRDLAVATFERSDDRHLVVVRNSPSSLVVRLTKGRLMVEP